ncbi:hypothetical protein BP5796_12443 [Coleophoma crateriformis]|uniref:Carboxypeptidase n=1 Tax=Coleophoma crateriformis TaxID=565419 RepID=A0A3D8Q9J3_9HELO|nr:hypothetical protein BP5796_12443 [Coleophoma crateriformis]
MLFTPLLTLLLGASHAQAAYVKINSTFDEANSIRVKHFEEAQLCDGGSKHHTGWADISDHHLFFWYHEARSTAIDPPLLIWLQGGPGGSSLIGCLAENGPCQVNDYANGTTYNPYSWTESFHVIYIDQPVGTGFSYVDEVDEPESYPDRTEQSALDFVTMLKLLYEAFPQLKDLPLHIAGESYAGRFIPVYAATIIDYNALADNDSKIPIASIMVGNGWSSPLDNEVSLYEISCYLHDSILPVFNTTECSQMANAVDQCEIMMEACVSVPDNLVCRTAGEYCDKHLLNTMEDKLLTPYDRTLKCPAPGRCYPDFRRATEWLNSTEVKERQLEVVSQSGSRKTSFEMSSSLISERYHDSGDFWTDSSPSLKKILDYTSSQKALSKDPGIDMLYYVGINDWICNPIGVRRLLERIKWKNHAEFRAMDMEILPWATKDGHKGTRAKKTDGLWYYEIQDAGHLVPRDQPGLALKMVQEWLDHVKSKSVKVGRVSDKSGSISGEKSLDAAAKQHALVDLESGELKKL